MSHAMSELGASSTLAAQRADRLFDLSSLRICTAERDPPLGQLRIESKRALGHRSRPFEFDSRMLDEIRAFVEKQKTEQRVRVSECRVEGNSLLEKPLTLPDSRAASERSIRSNGTARARKDRTPPRTL